MEIRRTLDNAGIAVHEFARQCGVSTNMAYKWIRGAKPHALRVDEVNKILAAITLATEDGELPLAGVNDMRAERLDAVVDDNLKKVA